MGNEMVKTSALRDYAAKTNTYIYLDENLGIKTHENICNKPSDIFLEVGSAPAIHNIIKYIKSKTGDTNTAVDITAIILSEMALVANFMSEDKRDNQIFLAFVRAVEYSLRNFNRRDFEVTKISGNTEVDVFASICGMDILGCSLSKKDYKGFYVNNNGLGAGIFGNLGSIHRDRLDRLCETVERTYGVYLLPEDFYFSRDLSVVGDSGLIFRGYQPMLEMLRTYFEVNKHELNNRIAEGWFNLSRGDLINPKGV